MRFPHIAEQILENLDVQSLSKCQKVSQCWQKFIFQTNFLFRQIENYTSIPRLMLQKSLKDYDFQTIHKLANCASISHKTAVEACIPFKNPLMLEPRGPTLFYYLLYEGKLDGTQHLLAKLILLNKMDKSTSMLTYYDNQEADGFRYAVSKQMTDARSGMFGEAYTVFKDMVIINQGKCGSLWSWIPILHVAVAQNHLTIIKLIFEQIQDIQTLHQWGKRLLPFAIVFGHGDMVKFFVGEIQGIDLLAEKIPSGENLIEMAERFGHKDIVIFLCGHKSFLKLFRMFM